MSFYNYRLRVVEFNRVRSIVRTRPLERTGAAYIGGWILERRPIEHILAE